MRASRDLVDEIVRDQRVTYGINTGFGKLSDVHIPPDRLRELQRNLVRSHACGVGNLLSPEETRAMLLLRANVLAKGLSGARVEVAETLIQMLEHGVLPCIPEKGSVGASGDLAPLAHLALVVIGEGEALLQGRRLPGGQALREAGIRPIELEAKEGLALLNGTQAMTSVGGLAVGLAIRLLEWADVAGAMSLEALLGTPSAFDLRIHEARGHPGQIEVARHLLDLLEDSEIRESHRLNDPRVQDAYSLRCMPQVHGAARDAFRFARTVLETETGAATDNPLVFTDNGDVISGGNFHGAPIAQVLDFAAIALTDLASISERRLDQLVNPTTNEHLPPFLASEPGICSGFMVAHVTVAALLNECKVLAHPSSVDSVPTSGGKEDHVSMGMVGATKLRTIAQNVRTILAIEMMAAAEGIDCRKPLRPGKGVAAAYEQVRSLVPRLDGDRSLAPDIERLSEWLRSA
jgi:histidine ammonia-lyase